MFKRSITLSLLLCILLLINACATKPNVFTDLDAQQDFSVYRTFSWTAEDPMIVQSDYPVNPFVGVRTKSAIKRVLESKGYQFVENKADADIAVGFTLGARDKIRTRNEPAVLHSNWRWGNQYFGPQIVNTTTTTSYAQGSLAIDVYDVKRKSPVWHGVASKRLSKKELEGAKENIDSAVDSILASFPIN